MAVAMALFLKHFVVEAYKIPTGSMQPTLIGDEAADVKDRILVDKVSYALGDPERWDVAVFHRSAAHVVVIDQQDPDHT
jgi:signal peptidase I